MQGVDLLQNMFQQPTMRGIQRGRATLGRKAIGRLFQQEPSTTHSTMESVAPFHSTRLKPKSTLFPPSKLQQIRCQSTLSKQNDDQKACSAAYDKFTCFRVNVEGGIARVTLYHPPLNLLDEIMSSEFAPLAGQLEHDTNVRVVILQSGLPDFFIAHSGLARIATGTKEASAARNFRLTQMIGETIRNIPKVTIAKVEGRCRGGGNEIAMAADMCFAALKRSVFGQPEVGFGLVPGGGATQRLPRLMGRARALEVLLTGQDFSAADAERMGFINRALPADELDTYVGKVAAKIARLPIHAIHHIKQSVDRGTFNTMSEGLLVEAQCADECMATDMTRDRVSQAVALGVETPEVELDVTSLLDRMK